MKPAEIHKKLSREIKNPALRWELQCLVDLGYVVREKQGKAYYYRAKVQQRGILKRVTRELAEIFSEGSSVGLIGKIVEAERFSPEELKQLQRLADPKSKKRPSPREKGRRS
jgi:predicted transcriptional regulator